VPLHALQLDAALFFSFQKDHCFLPSKRVNCKKPPQLGLGLQKTTSLQIFIKNQPVSSNSVTKTTD
jgi:hypothetical protein